MSQHQPENAGKECLQPEYAPQEKCNSPFDGNDQLCLELFKLNRGGHSI